MTKLEWDTPGSRSYESGVDHGVLYPANNIGVPWNGLVQVQELENDTKNTSVLYVDGQKYSTEVGLGSFAAVISALTYPEEFEEYDGYDINGLSGQRRKTFGFSYRTNIGSDTKGDEFGHYIHIVYNCLATPTTEDFVSLSSSSDPTAFSWGISTTPIAIPNMRNSSHLMINTLTVNPEVLSIIQDWLYGTPLTNPRLPTLVEVINLFDTYALIKVIDMGDGTARVIGPDENVQMVDSDTVLFSWPTVVKVSEDTYSISSF